MSRFDKVIWFMIGATVLAAIVVFCVAYYLTYYSK